MEDVIGALGGIAIAIWLVITVVTFIIGLTATALLWLGTNVVVLAEYALGLWPLPPVLSWALSGLALGSLTQYALVEHRRLPGASEGVLWTGLAAIAAVVAVAFGAAALATGA